MWREIGEKILESCAYMDPMVYMYYVAAKRESEYQAEVEATRARSAVVPTLRLVERCQPLKEART